VRRRTTFLDTGPSLREVVQGEQDVRRLRAEIAHHDGEARTPEGSTGSERARARARAQTTRLRLVRVLSRQMLPRVETTEGFLDRLDAWLDVERLDAAALDRLIECLTLNDDPKEAA
jgi:hypothetical protein